VTTAITEALASSSIQSRVPARHERIVDKVPFARSLAAAPGAGWARVASVEDAWRMRSESRRRPRVDAARKTLGLVRVEIVVED
jgi:hypothetical protein